VCLELPVEEEKDEEKNEKWSRVKHHEQHASPVEPAMSLLERSFN
jgi:hypothetical protein